MILTFTLDPDATQHAGAQVYRVHRTDNVHLPIHDGGPLRPYRLHHVVVGTSGDYWVAYLIQQTGLGRDYTRGGRLVLPAARLAEVHPNLHREITDALAAPARPSDPEAAAVRVLADAAGWRVPPDPDDPYTVRLAYRAARERLTSAATALGIDPAGDALLDTVTDAEGGRS